MIWTVSRKYHGRRYRSFDFSFHVRLLNAQGVVHPKLESEVYTINQHALTHSAPVAFSIRYRKGWTKAEDNIPGVGDISVRDGEVVCSFTAPLDYWAPLDHWVPPAVVTNYAFMTIFRTYRATAKEAAEYLAVRLRKDEVKSLSSIKTKAGDDGYLLICDEETPNGHRLRSEFFFGVGSKGHIQISIYVMGTFLGMHESPQNLVLESLRFPGG
jgi:hypothetical protein